MILEGSISVKAALESGKREFYRLLIQDKKRSKDINYLLFLCHERGVKIDFVSKEIIDSLASGHSHGGILLECSTRNYETMKESDHGDFVLLVEGIEDPYNLGGIMRSAYIAGVKTILIDNKDYDTMEMTILKSSAGYSERVNLVKTDSLKQDLTYLKEDGFTIYSALRNDQSTSFTQHNYLNKVCLCVGGEKRGLSLETIELSDYFIEIKYPVAAKNALSAIASANILCFEVVRQRMEGFYYENQTCSDEHHSKSDQQ